MDSLKVLIFNWRDTAHPQAGGAERATHEIARRWVQQGHKVQIICGNFRGGKKTDSIGGIDICRVGGRYSLYPQALFHYYHDRFQGKYDVIIDEINNIPFLTPLYVREPVVAFIHQIGANMLFEELPFIQAKSWAMLEPFLLRLYRDKQVITSESSREDLLRIGIVENNIHVINYGVDHDIYVPGMKKSDFPHVLYFGRLKRFKGVHLLVEAMKQVTAEIPEAKLSVVGTGDAQYLNELKTMTDRLNLNKNITFYELGFGDCLAKKVELMQESWVSVVPSAREGFGLVVVEANACGTPTIAANVPGLRDTVRNYETGILSDRDTDSLAKSIKYLLTHDDVRYDMSKKALDWSRHFDWDRTAEKTMGILKSVTNNSA